MNSEDEERMMYYARVTFLQAKQSQTTLQIIEQFLGYILSFGAAAIVYWITADKTSALVGGLLMYALVRGDHWMQHSIRNTKQFDM
jgi:hypothetical protein